MYINSFYDINMNAWHQDMKKKKKKNTTKKQKING